MARVLVVDDDPWTQRMVSSVLGHAGHRVKLAGDGWEGLLAADGTVPDLLVVKVKLPSADGWKLVETLRARVEMASLRVLYLAPFTEQERRGPGFRADSDEVLVTPFRLEDLRARVDHLLGEPTAPRAATPAGATPVPAVTPAAALDEDTVKMAVAEAAPAADQPAVAADEASVAAAPPARTALTGSLEQFGAGSVLMLLDLERRSGVVIVTGARGHDGARGRIYVRDGRVLRARLDGEGRPEVTGALAVYELLTWSAGHFEFHPGVIDGQDEIGSSTSFLLLEGARLQDEQHGAGAPGSQN
jgi:two-component system, chemotaxis family, chemotaxis protein CheY